MACRIPRYARRRPFIEVSARRKNDHNGVQAVQAKKPKHKQGRAGSMPTLKSASLVIVLAIACAFVFSTPAMLDLEDQFGLPALFGLHGRMAPPEGAVVLAIDEDSIAWVQRNALELEAVAPRFAACMTPQGRETLGSVKEVGDLPRDFYACLLEETARHEPGLVVVDVNFDLERRADEKLANAITALDEVVLVEAVKAVFDDSGHLQAIVRERPARRLLAAATQTGGFHVESGPNRVTTWYLGRFRPFVDIDAIPVVAAKLTGAAAPAVGTFQRIWYYGPAGALPRVSARAVFERSEEAAQLSSEAVFLGYATNRRTGAPDHFPVPFAGVAGTGMSGVEIAATAYLNIKSGRLIGEPSRATLIGVKFLLALVFAALATGRPARRKIFAASVVGAAALIVIFLLFVNQAYVAASISVIVMTALTAAAILYRRFHIAQHSTRALAPALIAEKLLEGADFSGRTETASVLFLDLVGSTQAAQSMVPEAYSRVIRTYYGVVGDQVEARGGILLEFRGDGILAVFRRESLGDRFAAAACNAVLDVKSAIDRNVADAGEAARIRVRGGIASGEVVLNSVTAGDRVVVSMVGDTVNIAARIEQIGRELFKASSDGESLHCLVDGATRELSQLPDHCFEFYREDILRGRQTSTALYKLAAPK